MILQNKSQKILLLVKIFKEKTLKHMFVNYYFGKKNIFFYFVNAKKKKRKEKPGFKIKIFCINIHTYILVSVLNIYTYVYIFIYSIHTYNKGNLKATYIHTYMFVIRN